MDDKIFEKMEPGSKEFAKHVVSALESDDVGFAALASAAISLKRIADLLQDIRNTMRRPPRT